MTDFLKNVGTPQGNNEILGAYILLLGIIMVYTYVVMALLNRVYSLIYLIPDRILRWIGGQPEQSATAQMMSRMQQQISGSGGQIAGGAGGMSQSIGAVQSPQSDSGLSVNQDDKGSIKRGDGGGGG